MRRLRYSTRTLIGLMTTICIYFAGWELTRARGVLPTVSIVEEIEAKRGPIPASHSPPYETSPAPFLIQRTEFGDFHSVRRFYVWFLGIRLELPYELSS